MMVSTADRLSMESESSSKALTVASLSAPIEHTQDSPNDR